MKRTPLLCTLGAALVLAGCTQTMPETAEPDTSEADAAAIESMIDEFIVAWNAGDVASLAGTYAEDAIQMPPEGPALEGRAAIIQSMEDFLSEFSATQTATMDEVSVHGDIAFARGTWNVRQTPEAGGAEEVRNGKWMEIYRRKADGSWEVWRWIWNQEEAESEAM